MFNLKHSGIYFIFFVRYKLYAINCDELVINAADVITTCAERMLFREIVTSAIGAFLSLFIKI